MSASKDRVRWHEIPPPVRAEIEQLIGGTVIAAQNCPGGFSPGFASRLTLADGRRVFVKAMDADCRPEEATTHRTEAVIAAALPATVPAPRFLGTFDNDHWVALAFEDIDGTEPPQPWNPTDLGRVVTAVGQLARAVTPSPVALPHTHPRLGGWDDLARDPSRLTRLPDHSRWAADNIARLVRLEEKGLAAAQGPSLVHFDLYPHNILLTSRGVLFVDWPHARLGAPVVDLVIVLSSAAADRINPEPILRDHAETADIEPATIDAVLAAHAGFLFSGGLSPTPPGLEPITEAKLHLGRGAVTWLRQRLTHQT
jgi:aminoglycoside phosphotransferase (APT) family kinase protein